MGFWFRSTLSIPNKTTWNVWLKTTKRDFIAKKITTKYASEYIGFRACKAGFENKTEIATKGIPNSNCKEKVSLTWSILPFASNFVYNACEIFSVCFRNRS